MPNKPPDTLEQLAKRVAEVRHENHKMTLSGDSYIPQGFECRRCMLEDLLRLIRAKKEEK